MALDYKAPRRPKRPIKTDDSGFAMSDAWSIQTLKNGRWVIHARRGSFSEIVGFADGIFYAVYAGAAAGPRVKFIQGYIVGPDGQPYRGIEYPQAVLAEPNPWSTT